MSFPQHAGVMVRWYKLVTNRFEIQKWHTFPASGLCLHCCLRSFLTKMARPNIWSAATRHQPSLSVVPAGLFKSDPNPGLASWAKFSPSLRASNFSASRRAVFSAPRVQEQQTG